MNDEGRGTIMKKIGFVVLHYLTYEETKHCIDSILALPTGDDQVDVVVVDNHSDNGSYERLKELPEHPHVHFIHNEANLGFANGMNVGYRYAREVLKSDVIALMNNDLTIPQRDFLHCLDKVVDRGFDVIGPDIIEPAHHDLHTNPLLPEASYPKAYLRFAVIRAFFTVMPKSVGYRVFDKFKRSTSTSTDMRTAESDTLALREHENVQLHGACLILANRFVRDEVQCLDDRTFLYHEEDLLFQYCMRKLYRIIYTPTLRVDHESGASTDAVAHDERSKKITNLKYHMQSMKYVLKVTKKYGRYYPKY